MQKYLRELKPTVFEDLIAMNALYRPGPMKYIPQFIDRKHGREEITYPIPCMEKYLKDTYGITVYQEQVMLLSRQLADFTRGESDALRKAMGKKKIDIVNAMKPKFIEGGKKNGHDPQILEKIWTDWEDFASYAFNKSHAACYSWVAYQTAYLKANYPPEFMAAIMSRRKDDIKEITKLMDECKAMGIATLGPDVNESYQKFGVNHHGEIRFGLAAIKGMGDSVAQAIIDEREKNGPYKDIFDFAQRVNMSAVNRKAFESLALSGAFDSFGIARERFFGFNAKGEPFFDTLIRYGQTYQMEQAQMQNSLFGGVNEIEIATPPIPEAEAWGDIEKLNRERELVGIYLSAHPLDEYQVVLNHVCNTKMKELDDLAALKTREELTFGGMVVGLRKGVSKHGDQYGIVKIEDYSGSAEVPFWRNDWAVYQGFLQEKSFVFIHAKVDQNRWKPELLELKFSKVELLSEVKDSVIHKFTVTLPLDIINEPFVDGFTEICQKCPGNADLFIKILDREMNLCVDMMSHPVKVAVDRQLISYLEQFEDVSYGIN